MKTRFSLLTAGVALVALAGCMDPESPRTQTGVATGAAIGGVLGATTGQDNRLARAAVGAVIGGAIGGAIGQQLDRQAAELRRDLGDRVDVRNTGQELVLTMDQDILFATDSAVLRPDLQRELRLIAANLRANPNSLIYVVGHTDSTGAAAYNQTLSERRANSVAAVLRSEGVPANRIEAFGRGESDPVASNLTPEGRALNRRVEIIIRPLQA